ncbi:hypothetical protein [Lentzea cavernae]|nr:hypothetical protein [Lentzea cavernae]
MRDQRLRRRLAATAPAPDSAELSEERYFELALRRANRALTASR